MKQREVILSKRILASLLAGVLLGSAFYAQPAAAGKVVNVITQDDYDNGWEYKDDAGNVYPKNSLNDNIVTIGKVGGTDVPDITYGGSGFCCGAYAEDGETASGNRVDVLSGKFSNVYGAYSSSYDTSTLLKYNCLTVSGGSMQGFVAGAFCDAGDVMYNSAEISGGTFAKYIYGAGTFEGDASYNSLTVSGDTTNIEGYTIAGGWTDEGTVTHNVVKVSGGKATDASVYGGYTESTIVGGTATYNTAIIEGGTVYSVCGGFSADYTAQNNTVEISGGEIGSTIYEGYVYGGKSTNGDATGNTVTISGGTIYGGYVCGGESSNGNATGNTVTISGGTIYGGYVCGGESSNGNATGNTVTISGTPTFGEKTVLYGGESYSGGEVSGNTLNFNSKGLAVANVKNFDVYNFYLPDTVQANDTLLTLTDSAGDGTDLTGSTVNVEGRLAGTSSIQNNDRLVLLANSSSEINAGGKKELGSGQIMQGVSVVYDYITKMSSDNKQVLVEFTNGKATAQSKSPVETQLAAAAFINSGADTVAGSGIASAVQVAGSGGAEMFGAMSGGSMRYKSGSYADVQGYNMALGLAKAVDNNAGKLTYGSLLEYGWGNYTSHLDSGIRADGSTKYYGIGLLARQDNNSGVYYEGSLRYGRMDADYASNDLGTAGVHSSYDSSSVYYGAHLGIGKVTELNDTTKADVYAKLLYTHQNGDSVTLQGEGNGEEYDFDAVDSTRARVGARVSKAYSERGTGYVGLAYEYEFDGEARATVKGFSTPSPSIKGSSGLLELGYILQPKGVNDPNINIGLQGWGGKKQGVTGNVNFVWTF